MIPACGYCPHPDQPCKPGYCTAGIRATAIPTGIDYRPHPEFDVYRNDLGQPVTITPQHCVGDAKWRHQQFAAFLHAWTVRAELVRRHKTPAEARLMNDLSNVANYSKSCLMGRMLYDGLPPLTDPPPLVMAAPDYSVAL